MEAVASKIFEKLDKAEGPILISAQEKSELAYFLAMQVARTPAFRDSLKQQAIEFAKLYIRTIECGADQKNCLLGEKAVAREKQKM